ncbi:MAG TPA: DUF192 domain-containing protein [Anaerolineae bacterium]|nr:DUF192 domain-containing protein [Anaerolineae bacterium]
MSSRQVMNTTRGEVLLAEAKWCNSFMTKLRGFTFKKSLSETEGLVLVEKSDSKLATSIHMLFVNFDLGVIWVNSAGLVVHTVVAKPWKLSYAPPAPARYVIEGHPVLLDKVAIGDKIAFPLG